MTDSQVDCSKCGTENAPGSKSCSFCGTPLGPSAAHGTTPVQPSPTDAREGALQPGELFAGRYHVEALLGVGGMGEVYLARDQKMNGRQTAIKFMSAALMKDDESRRRFVQEVEAAQLLRHENIVTVYHLDEAGGRDFFTMAYVPGKSLREVMTERFDNGETFFLGEAAAALMPVLSALVHAHERKVIHRDLKPENIIIDGDFSDISVKVLDFGLARIMSQSRMTSTAVAMGTAYYMAPEQLSGKGEVDHRSDLFSVGVIFYELLTGEMPAGRFELPSSLVKGLPSEVDEIVEIALASRSEKRFRDAAEFEGALSRLSDGESPVRQREKERQAAESKTKGEAERRTAEEENKITNALGMAFAYIKPGTFMMGSPEDEPERENDEIQHQVTLTQGYYMQTTPVTQGQWKAVMGGNPSEFGDCGDECPVETVSWDDAQEFIRKLNRRKGRDVYRLPTEAEWEYAARAGSKTAYFFGDDPDDLSRYAWYEGNSGGKTHPVGQKPSNGWGLHDLYGNVWEWVAARYGVYPSSAVADPVGPSSGAYRVMRGNFWSAAAGICRSAYRGRYFPGSRRNGYGFRLARLPDH